MPEPLKQKRRGGTPYERPAEIEDWLKKLEAVDVAERLRQFATVSRKSPGYVPSEVLIHFLRRTWTEGMRGDFENLFRILMKRVEQSLCLAISDLCMVGARGIREEIMLRFAERIAKDCQGRTSLLDFYEIHFDQAFAAFRTSALRQIGPSTVDTVPLGTDEDDGLEISAEVEAAAADFLGGNPEIIDDPAFRSALTAAIDQLPDDQKQVIGLLLQGFQIDSKDKDVMTIARILQCDERTVRNRRDRAVNALRAILQEEDAQ
ncbi:RNA polymerase sigma factor [Acidithiobacillus ferriphilus]|uniref:RNA polymerase sigma factor n=1 Tax=Acidithiobacillus ferriphilus TaxID=1689834 RepID=UPI002DB73571|nr:sigma-70 family RNA polymerase sigma factor [Acidithiobacillus ferriphilus]MEB8536877.1 sigma-70 family RNA polymerase sigma factor [Acidithiobacillus ferriphilus]